MQATAYLKHPAKHPPKAMVVLFGSERYLKHRALKALLHQVLGDDADDLSTTRLSGTDCDFTTVSAELRTVAMFGTCRVVLIEDADEFVTKYRKNLEAYLEKPAKKGLLVLEVKSWPGNTKLAKRLPDVGLDLDCAPLKAADLPRWLVEHTQHEYGRTLNRDAAATLTQLAGTDLAQLDQELAKLAAYVGDNTSIDVAAVEKLVGGWKAETTWGMLDAVRDGNLSVALHLLEKLIQSGEHPLKLLGGIHFTFRPLAKATELTRQGQILGEALVEAGVKPFNQAPAAAYLKRIGRPRAEKILAWLLQADRDLKGSSHLPERIVMERLLWQLAGKT